MRPHREWEDAVAGKPELVDGDLQRPVRRHAEVGEERQGRVYQGVEGEQARGRELVEAVDPPQGLRPVAQLGEVPR